MNMQYQRDLGRNYLIISDTDAEQHMYMLRMLEQNDIPGFLPLHTRRLNGQLELCYDITSRQMLRQLYQTAGLNYSALLQLLSSILSAFEEGRKYLLDQNCIPIAPSWIYVDPDSMRAWVLLLPGVPLPPEEDFPEFILTHLDHKDPRAVELGYAFYALAAKSEGNLLAAAEGAIAQAKATENAPPEGPPARSEENQKRQDEPRGPWEQPSDLPPDSLTQGLLSGLQSFPVQENPADSSSGSNKSRKKHGKTRRQKPRSLSAKQKSDTSPGVREAANDPGSRRILWIILSVSLTVSLYALLLFLLQPDLTQTGGLGFLFLAIYWLAWRMISARKEASSRKKSGPDIRSQAQQQLYVSLLSDVYDQEISAPEAATDKKPSPADDSVTEILPAAGGSSPSDASPDDFGVTQLLPAEGWQPQWYLIPDQEGETIFLANRPIIIGKKSGQTDVCLPHDSISRIHARLEKINEEILITDLNSTNGTFVNGVRLAPHEQRPLVSGDRLGLGSLTFTVKCT